MCLFLFAGSDQNMSDADFPLSSQSFHKSPLSVSSTVCLSPSLSPETPPGRDGLSCQLSKAKRGEAIGINNPRHHQ